MATAPVTYDQSFNGIASMTGVMFLLPTITLALRLLARYRQKAKLGWDDVFAIVAWLFVVASIIITIYGMAIHALGYSTPTDKATAAAEREALWKALWAGILTSTLAMGFARMSAVFFFRRIFVSTKVDVWDFITKFMITIIALWTLGFCIATVLACGTNVPGVWAPTNTTVCALYPEGKALTMSSFILDFIVLVLPLPKIWKLHTSGTRKIALSLVFLMALVGVASGAVRAFSYYAIINRGAAALAQDANRANTLSHFYQLLEMGAVTTAVNLPSVWYFIHGLTPESLLRSVRSLVSLRSSSSTSSSQNEKGIFRQDTNMSTAPNGPVSTKRAHHELDI